MHDETDGRYDVELIWRQVRWDLPAKEVTMKGREGAMRYASEEGTMGPSFLPSVSLRRLPRSYGEVCGRSDCDLRKVRSEWAEAEGTSHVKRKSRSGVRAGTTVSIAPSQDSVVIVVGAIGREESAIVRERQA